MQSQIPAAKKQLPSLCPTIENKKYNQFLHQVTIFPISNTNNIGVINCAVLSFRFKTIIFNKKRTLPFFLARELLTYQKCVASLANKDIQSWKIRKGILIGCKVTLRNENLHSFINTLTFTRSRIENFKPYINYIDKLYKKKEKKRPSFIFTVNELIFFEAIDLCLGMQPDIKQLIIHFRFSTFYKEDCFFLLRSAKRLVF